MLKFLNLWLIVYIYILKFVYVINFSIFGVGQISTPMQILLFRNQIRNFDRVGFWSYSVRWEGRHGKRWRNLCVTQSQDRLFLPFATPMAISRIPKSKQRPRSLILLLAISAVALVLFFVLFSSSIPTSGLSSPRGASDAAVRESTNGLERKYLFWGSQIDCPGKHCDSCAGLGHQESSLRCALEEALFLQRWNLFRFFDSYS